MAGAGRIRNGGFGVIDGEKRPVVDLGLAAACDPYQVIGGPSQSAATNISSGVNGGLHGPLADNVRRGGCRDRYSAIEADCVTAAIARRKSSPSLSVQVTSAV
jgi:hypothetical protein